MLHMMSCVLRTLFCTLLAMYKPACCAGNRSNSCAEGQALNTNLPGQGERPGGSCLQALPGQAAQEQEEQRVGERLQVVAPAGRAAQVRVHARVADCPPAQRRTIGGQQGKVPSSVPGKVLRCRTDSPCCKCVNGTGWPQMAILQDASQLVLPFGCTANVIFVGALHSMHCLGLLASITSLTGPSLNCKIVMPEGLPYYGACT